MRRTPPLPVVGSIVLAVTGLLLWSGTGRAYAHTELEVSVPAADEVVTALVDSVELTFSSDVQPDFAQVAVTGPDGEPSAAGPITVDGSMVQLPVDIKASGGYVVAYRIVSTDGHPVDGQYDFSYRGNRTAEVRPSAAETGSATRSPTAPPSAGPQGTAGAAGSASPLWWGVIGGSAAAGAGALAVVVLRRRRTHG